MQCGEGQVEAHVGAARSALVNFHREYVRALDEHRVVDVRREPSHFIRVVNRTEGRCAGIHRAGTHVGAGHFDSVEIDNSAVVAHQAKLQVGDGSRVGRDKRFAEVRGDDPRAVGPVGANDGCFVAITVAELRAANTPGTVCEIIGAPFWSGRRAVIQVAPRRARTDEINW